MQPCGPRKRAFVVFFSFRRIAFNEMACPKAIEEISQNSVAGRIMNHLFFEKRQVIKPKVELLLYCDTQNILRLALFVVYWYSFIGKLAVVVHVVSNLGPSVHAI